MAFSPSSVVYLCDTPLDNSYKNELYFASKTAQNSYFDSVVKHKFTDYTFIKKDNVIRVNKNIEVLWNVNYCFFINSNFGSKRFYCFITDMKYINESCTEVSIETDVYQTWLFEAEIQKSFVVREHVSPDNKRENLVDEQLETGEYKVRSVSSFSFAKDISFIVAVSDLPQAEESSVYGSLYGGIYSGLRFIVYHKAEVENMSNLLANYDEIGKGDSVVMIFTIPTFLVSNFQSGSVITSSTKPPTLVHSIAPNYRDIDGYVPKNNKLFNYPYNMLYVSNNSGSGAEYRLEDFSLNNGNIRFQIQGAITPNTVLQCVPLDYKGLSTAYEYLLSLSGFPQCSWKTDVFKNWISQNAMQVGITSLTGIGAVAFGVASGNAISAVGGATAVFSQIAQVYKQSIQPDQAKGNVQGTTPNIANDNNNFYFYEMTIKAEQAKRIDDYFHMYGYKVNTVKVPNIGTRPCWNYVQTIDINIDGSIPSDDMRRLKKIYNDGVTLWNRADYIGHYEYNNK